jgi:hypothetical protein
MVGQQARPTPGGRLVSNGGPRFDDLVHCSGLSEAVAASVASGRLKELVAHGLLARRPYQVPGTAPDMSTC